MNVDELLRLMTERGASDLHLKPARPPLLRVDGKITPIDAPELKPEEIGRMLSTILQPHQKAKLENEFSVDLGYGVPGLARFRCNVYLQRGTLAASFRLIPYKILGVDALELPDVMLDLCTLKQGLVLVTGPTGSGKSTTLAALGQAHHSHAGSEHHHHRRPDGVPDLRFQGDGLAARSGHGYSEFPRGAAQRSAPGSGRDHGR